MKIEKIFTLSVYETLIHRTWGKVKNKRNLSFAESIVPLTNMIKFFNKVPLGSKIKVTMEYMDET